MRGGVKVVGFAVGFAVVLEGFPGFGIRMCLASQRLSKSLFWSRFWEVFSCDSCGSGKVLAVLCFDRV